MIVKHSKLDINEISSAQFSGRDIRDKNLLKLQTYNKQLLKKVYQLQNLVEVSYRLNSVLDEEQIIHTYLLNLFGLLSTRSVVILSAKTPYSDKFTPIYYQGIGKAHAETLTVGCTDPIFRLLQLHHHCLVLNKHAHLAKKSKFLNQVANLECQLLTPLVHRDHRFGLVIIGNKHNNKPYSLAEIDIFTTLTNFLAVALSNARIYEEMERISLTDPLTGLFNRRYFDNYLDTEIARAKRFEHPLSLVMLDVDHFKNYNDQLGHLNGDHLLVSLAEVLTLTVRRSDIVARYGGEEFCIILPEIARDGALVFSERLRNTISAHPFRKREVQPDGHVSISIGTATYPDDAQASNDLVEKADKAMYQAKNSGRNRVAVFD